MKKKNNKTVRTSLSAISVMLCTFLSRILGFIRIAVIGAFFGATGEADVLNSVFSIPNNLRKLMAEGALSSAFIPVLSETMVREKENGVTRKIVRNIITFQVIVIVPVCLVSIVFSDFLINRVLLEFSDPELQALAVKLFRRFISYLLLISISAAIMAVLNSHSFFFIPAVTPIIFSITVISSVIFLYNTLGVYSMVVGVLTGGVLQVVFQLPVFFRLGYDFRADTDFSNHYFVKIMKNWFPVVATASVFAINQQIAIRFASGLTTGSSSALSYAIVLWQLPFGIFSASITTVLFPKMSKLAAEGLETDLLQTMNTGIINLYALLLPSSVFLFLMGPEIISIAMQRGSFSPENTGFTAFVLKGYAPGLFITGIFNFLQRFYYSGHKYGKPFISAVIVCIVDVVLSLILKETWLAVCGLAIANTIAFFAGAVIMFIDIKKGNKNYNFRALMLDLSKISLCLVLPSLFLYLSRAYYGHLWINGLSFGLSLYFFISALIFSAAVLVLYKLSGISFIFFRQGRKL